MATPLQFSCLENHRNRAAWQAIVHRFTKALDPVQLLKTAADPIEPNTVFEILTHRPDLAFDCMHQTDESGCTTLEQLEGRALCPVSCFRDCQHPPPPLSSLPLRVPQGSRSTRHRGPCGHSPPGAQLVVTITFKSSLQKKQGGSEPAGSSSTTGSLPALLCLLTPQDSALFRAPIALWN